MFSEQRIKETAISHLSTDADRHFTPIVIRASHLKQCFIVRDGSHLGDDRIVPSMDYCLRCVLDRTDRFRGYCFAVRVTMGVSSCYC